MARCPLAAVVAAAAVAWAAGPSQAQIIGIAATNVNGYYVTDQPQPVPGVADNPNARHIADTVAGAADPFTVGAVGPIPTLPRGAAGGAAVVGGFAFGGAAAAGGRGYSGGTANATNSVQTAILASFVNNAPTANGALVLSPQATPFGGSHLLSGDALPAPAYSAVRLNFSVDYTIGAAGLAAGNVNAGYVVSANVANVPGAFAHYRFEADYYDVVGGVPAFLGAATLDTGALGPGFNGQVNPNGVFAVGGIAAGGGHVLRITGAYLLECDPAEITVNPVPEPSSLALAGLAGGLAAWRRRWASR